jgi:hypothetical protein
MYSAAPQTPVAKTDLELENFYLPFMKPSLK